MPTGSQSLRQPCRLIRRGWLLEMDTERGENYIKRKKAGRGVWAVVRACCDETGRETARETEDKWKGNGAN